MIITFAKSFEKQFKKLAKKRKQIFKERLVTFEDDIFNKILNNHKLTGGWAGHRSINITGNYRAIYREDNHAVIFVAIGTHSQLYRK